MVPIAPIVIDNAVKIDRVRYGTQRFPRFARADSNPARNTANKPKRIAVTDISDWKIVSAVSVKPLTPKKRVLF